MSTPRTLRLVYTGRRWTGAALLQRYLDQDGDEHLLPRPHVSYPELGETVEVPDTEPLAIRGAPIVADLPWDHPRRIAWREEERVSMAAHRHATEPCRWPMPDRTPCGETRSGPRHAHAVLDPAGACRWAECHAFAMRPDEIPFVPCRRCRYGLGPNDDPCPSCRSPRRPLSGRLDRAMIGIALETALGRMVSAPGPRSMEPLVDAVVRLVGEVEGATTTLEGRMNRLVERGWRPVLGTHLVPVEQAPPALAWQVRATWVGEGEPPGGHRTIPGGAFATIDEALADVERHALS